MKWSEKYATGIERIDRQHQMIFQMAEDYRNWLKKGNGERTYGILIEFLDRYCRSHFGFEERCMVQYRCPVAEKNKEAHATFLTLISDFRQRYETHGYQYTDAIKLIEFVDQWLDKHICHIDIRLRDCVIK